MKYNKSYLLIDPIYNNGDIPPNISLGQIECQLINSGYNVELVDFVEPSCEHGDLSYFFQMEQRFFLKILEKAQKANIVYISGGYGNALKPYPFFPRIIKIAQLLKKAYPSLYVVTGGALINYYKKIYNISDTLISKGLIDYILVGNELSFIPLFTNGTFTNRIDLGYSNWHNWEIGKYPNYRSILYHIGCPYKCDFCFEGKIYNQNFIIETQDSFINTMCSAIENGNIRNFIIEDSTFISYKDFDTIVERIKDLGVSFSIYARISEIIRYPNRVKQLKNAGCCAFIIGFETLDDNFLIEQHKGTKSSNNKYIISFLNDLGINIQGCFMLGFPQDTIDNMSRTIDYAIKQELNGYRWHIFQPNYNQLSPNFYSASKITPEDHLLCQINMPDHLLGESIRLNPEICLLDEHFLPRAKNSLLPYTMELESIGYHNRFNYSNLLSILLSMPSNMILNEEKLYHELFKPIQ